MPQIFRPPMKRGHAVQPEVVNHRLQEGDLLPGRFDERHVQRRPRDFEHQPWKPGSAADVYQPARRALSQEGVQRREHPHGVENEQPLDRLRLLDRRQVESRIPLQEQITVPAELPELPAGQPRDQRGRRLVAGS
jgi:hypothetical protein